MHHTCSPIPNHFPSCLTTILCTLLTGPNPFSPSSGCPSPLPPFFPPPLSSFSLFSQEGDETNCVISELLHTSPQHASPHSSVPAAVIPFFQGPSASAPPLLPHLPSLLYYQSLLCFAHSHSSMPTNPTTFPPPLDLVF